MDQRIRSSLLGRIACAALVVVASGAARVASAQIDATSFGGQDDARFGDALVNVGDVDGDGIDDLLVAEPRYDDGTHAETGRASLYSGATMTWIRDHDGALDGDGIGLTIAAAGDFDGDGLADYAVGSSSYSTNGLTENGRVVIFSGATGSALWSIDGPNSHDQYGLAICVPGDLDGDGKPDVLFTMAQDLVKAVSSTGVGLYDVDGLFDGFGRALARGVDLDGDGVPDWYAGAPDESVVLLGQTLLGAGAVYAISGADGTVIYRVDGAHAFDGFGTHVAAVGDLDGDGFPDVIASGPRAFAGGSLRGIARVFSGKAGSALFEFSGSSDNDELGRSVAGIRDVNHDGVDDFLIGAPGVVNFYVTRGQVQICSGKDGTLLFAWTGSGGFNSGNHALGAAVAGGDFNGDGIGDLVVGDPFDVVQYSDRTTHQVGEAIEILGCPAWWENYGNGWPGKNGVPALTALNDPSPGLPLTIQVDNSLGSLTLGLLFVGVADANVQTGKGGTLLVSPALTIPLAIPATNLQLNATLPNDPALDFLDLYLQAIEADSFASKGLSFTAGLRLRIGFDLP